MTHYFEENKKNLSSIIEKHIHETFDGPIQPKGRYDKTFLVSSDNNRRVEFTFEILDDYPEITLHEHLRRHRLHSVWKKACEENNSFCIVINEHGITINNF